MTNLPSVCPLDTAGGPIASTIITVVTPFLVAVALLLGVLAVLVVPVALRARSARRRLMPKRSPGLAPSYRIARQPR